MSEWIRCRICGHLWDCLCPELELFRKCYNCSDWSFQQIEEGRRKIQQEEAESMERLRKRNNVELIDKEWWKDV